MAIIQFLLNQLHCKRSICFGNRLEQLNISVDELLTKFGQELLKICKIKASKFDRINGSSVEWILPIEKLLFVSETYACYSLPFSKYPFTFKTDYIRIRVDKNDLPFARIQCRDQRCWTWNEDFVDKITLDMPGREIGAIAGNQLPFSMEFLQIVTTQLSINSAIESLSEVDGFKRCSRKKTREECQRECRLNAVELQCNCTPASYSKLQAQQSPKARYVSDCCYTH